MKKNAFEVFRDLNFECSADKIPMLKQAMIERCAYPWKHCPDKEQKAKAFGKDGYIVFERDKFDDIEAAGLFLLERPSGLYVANIVPQESGELGITKYNLILVNFAAQVGEPAAKACGIASTLTGGEATASTWMSELARKLLESFSALANKSTGAAHPSDQKRWRRFLMTVHNERAPLRADQLKRILVEQQEWSADRAFELAIEFEFAMELLKDYDELR